MKKQSLLLLMPGGGLEDIWGGGRHQKCINHLGGGLPKISEKGRGGAEIMYNIIKKHQQLVFLRK